MGICTALSLLAGTAAGCAGTTSSDIVAMDDSPETSTKPTDGAAPSAASGASGASGEGSSGPQGAAAPNVLGAGTPVTIAFAGDITFEDAAADLLAADPNTVFGPAAAVLSSADFTIANLESAITTGGGAQASKQFVFSAPPTAFDAIRAAGIDVVSMANNHGMDFGEVGLQQSLAAIAEKQFPVVGIGANIDAAFAPHIATVNGQRLGVIGATQVLDSNLVTAWTATATQAGLASAKLEDRLVQAVTAARAQVDTLIVFLHWGTEKETCPNDAQKALAPKLVAAGADIVVGGHAHRVQSAGYLGTAAVGYGLGNYLFKSTSDGAKKSGVLKITATGRRIDSLEWLPARINDADQPIPLDGDAAAAAVASWTELRGCTGLADAPTPLPGT